jgi:DNA-binding transcriptional regulator YhcF (GntR family)
VPPYEQIRAQVATMIASGVLAPGDRLPPVRQLAADLGLATNTVARAYRELEASGLVAGRVRHGTTVTGQATTLTPSEARRRLAEAARTFAITARQLGVTADEAERAIREHLAQSPVQGSPPSR